MADENLPWMKFYPSDFMGSPKVRSMTGRQRGIYISLLCHSWEEGAIPDDPNELWMRCGVTPQEMDQDWPKVRRCFYEHPNKDGYLLNERVEEERELAQKRRTAAKKAASFRSEGADRGKDGRFIPSDDPAADPAGAPPGAPAAAGTEGGAAAPADAPAARPAPRPAMRASDASEAQSPEGTENSTEVEDSQSTESSSEPGGSALRELADLDTDAVKEATKALIAAWVETRTERPPEKQIAKQGAVAKRLAQDTEPRKLAIALYGMDRLYPYSEGEPWDLFRFEKRFSEALEKGAQAIQGGEKAADRKLKRTQERLARLAREEVGA